MRLRLRQFTPLGQVKSPDHTVVREQGVFYRLGFDSAIVSYIKVLEQFGDCGKLK